MTELIVWAIMATVYFTGLIGLIAWDPSNLKEKAT